jgi:hypothetical protein
MDFDFIDYFETKFNEKYSEKKFDKYFGHKVEILCFVFNEAKFEKCGDIETFLYFFSFVKNENHMLHLAFRVSTSHFETKDWDLQVTKQF